MKESGAARQKHQRSAGRLARVLACVGAVALGIGGGCGTSTDGGVATSGSSAGSSGASSQDAGSASTSGGSGSSSGSGGSSGSPGSGSTSGSSSGGGTSGGSSGAMDDGGPETGSSGSGDDGGDGGAEGGALRPDVLAIMEKVADWQIAQLGTSTAKTWVEATFYAGLMAAYHTTEQARFLQKVESWGAANQWQLGPRQTNADDQCAGQAYLEAYAMDQKPAELTPTQTEIDAMVAAPMPGRVVWWWCDSLFMAPGVFARLGGATSQTKYFDAMSTMWWDTTSYLQDATDKLFWRDSTYFNKTCPNGQKMFWARGNGWVLAGVARVLDDLPQSHPDYAKFVTLLQTMAAKIASLQRPDGYWSSCLTDTKDYPEPETSGTAAFTYALAWGVHHGVLSAAQYGAVVQNGWKALVAAVDSSGMLGWVQGVGAAPGPSTATGTAVFGVGLFLLAGSEVANLPP